jgi:TetR/AcrR family transcriptional regulator, transcriptional repressor for nem operon
LRIEMSKGDITRQRILAEAAAIFNQRGYEGCSIQAIMMATGLEKGGIYRHFESKEELAAEAFDYAWTIASSKQRMHMDEIRDPVEKLKQHLANFLVRSGLPGGCPLLNTAVDSDNGNPILRDKVRKALRSWQTMIIGILDDGIAVGILRSEIDRSAVANHIIGSLEGAMLVNRIERNDTSVRQTVERLDGYLESLRCSSQS